MTEWQGVNYRVAGCELTEWQGVKCRVAGCEMQSGRV